MSDIPPEKMAEYKRGARQRLAEQKQREAARRERALQVTQRMHLETEELEATVKAVSDHWTRAQALPEHYDAFIHSVALNLHAFYSGLERIFGKIANVLDGGVLGGESWQKELLPQMTLDLPGVRPAVLSRETANALDRYRGFRHLVRNVYTTHLDPERIRQLVAGLPSVWDQVQEDLGRFQNFLQELARADEDES